MTLPDIYFAVVTQNKDPLKLERIKVRLPWLDRGDEDQTEWAQLATPMGGNKFGWYTLPDIDDVVIVGFISGDIKRPVVLGGIWSKTDAPPEVNEGGKNDFRGYTSRTGHRMILDDSSNVKVVFADKSTNLMIGVGKMAVGGSGENKCAIHKPPMSGSEGVSISAVQGTFEMTAKGKLTIKAGQNIKINAKTTIGIKAGSSLTLQGSVAKLSSGAVSSYASSRTKIG
jgi:uncharacterized protein involved in type VI secretion and phage assembly